MSVHNHTVLTCLPTHTHKIKYKNCVFAYKYINAGVYTQRDPRQSMQIPIFTHPSLIRADLLPCTADWHSLYDQSPAAETEDLVSHTFHRKAGCQMSYSYKHMSHEVRPRMTASSPLWAECWYVSQFWAVYIHVVLCTKHIASSILLQRDRSEHHARRNVKEKKHLCKYTNGKTSHYSSYHNVTMPPDAHLLKIFVNAVTLLNGISYIYPPDVCVCVCRRTCVCACVCFPLDH